MRICGICRKFPTDPTNCPTRLSLLNAASMSSYSVWTATSVGCSCSGAFFGWSRSTPWYVLWISPVGVSLTLMGSFRDLPLQIYHLAVEVDLFGSVNAHIVVRFLLVQSTNQSTVNMHYLASFLTSFQLWFFCLSFLGPIASRCTGNYKTISSGDILRPTAGIFGMWSEHRGACRLQVRWFFQNHTSFLPSFLPSWLLFCVSEYDFLMTRLLLFYRKAVIQMFEERKKTRFLLAELMRLFEEQWVWRHLEIIFFYHFLFWMKYLPFSTWRFDQTLTLVEIMKMADIVERYAEGGTQMIRLLPAARAFRANLASVVSSFHGSLSPSDVTPPWCRTSATLPNFPPNFEDSNHSMLFLLHLDIFLCRFYSTLKILFFSRCLIQHSPPPPAVWGFKKKNFSFKIIPPFVHS